jgi:phage terminase large subunit-like protein
LSRNYPHVIAANRYARDVVDGDILACQLVKLACKRHLDDLERAKAKDWPYRFDKEKAERACKFAELLPHVKGRWAHKQERLKLEPWQSFIRCNEFGWVKKSNGLRRFRESYTEVPRKNGKSMDAAATGLYMFCMDGEFGAEVYSGATSEKQAWEVFRPARLICKRTPELCEAKGIDVNASNLARPEDGSRFEPLIGKPGDGSSPSCAIIDEFHEHDTPELVDTMETGMGARDQPLLKYITTAGNNLAGPCYAKRAQVVDVLKGVITNDELFGIIYTIDEDDDWSSDLALRKANPNYGVSVGSDYLQSRLKSALQIPSQQVAFKTKHLNVWGGAKNAWMNMQAWNACPAVKPLDELAGRRCFMSLDLASKIDVAPLGLLFPPIPDDPLWHFHVRYYLPEEMVEEGASSNASHYAGWAKEGYITLTPGNVIDYDIIMDDMREFAGQFEVIESLFDPWQAAHLANIMTAEGLNMVEMRQTVANFSEPMKEVEKLVLSKLLAHGNNPVTNWMASNVVAKLDAKDNIYPTKEHVQKKIDGIVALIMAMGRALVHQEQQPLTVESWFL